MEIQNQNTNPDMSNEVMVLGYIITDEFFFIPQVRETYQLKTVNIRRICFILRSVSYSFHQLMPIFNIFVAWNQNLVHVNDYDVFVEVYHLVEAVGEEIDLNQTGVRWNPSVTRWLFEWF